MGCQDVVLTKKKITLYKLLLKVGRGVIQSKLEENAVQFRLMWIALLRRVRHRDEATEWIAERVG